MDLKPQPDNAEPKQHPSMAMGYLYSPPEMPLGDSFSSDQCTQEKMAHSPFITISSVQTKLPPMQQAPSPPVSPAISTLPSFRSVTEATSVDTPLYRRAGSYESVKPLFPSEDYGRRVQIPARRMTEWTAPPRPTRTSPPSAEDLKLVQSFAEQMKNSYKKSPVAYRIARLAEIQQMQAFGRSFARQPRAVPSPKKMSQSNGVHKRKRSVESKPTVRKAPHIRRTAPQQHFSYRDDLQAIDYRPTPDAKPKPKRASPSKMLNIKEDVEYADIPDYSPALSTLAQTSRRLSTSWKGQPLDLSDDPDRHNCHEQEIVIAQILRLSCASYLTTKRRIFEARLACLREHKNFSKTQAQLVVKIDVNKASRLHEAFDRVGWFDERHFERALQAPTALLG